MKRKLKIVHVIYSLGRGGAETLLVNLLKDLNERYEFTLVTLDPRNDFAKEEIIAHRFYCLHYKGAQSIPSCVWKLRAIIQKVKPDLVRSQLFETSIVARVATPASIPMIFSIHNPLSVDCYSKNRFALPLEKLTYKRRHSIISVSKDSLQDFDKYVGLKSRSFILYNFINPVYVERAQPKLDFDYADLRLVAVGNLREQKNYGYLLKAFKQLKNYSVTLHIYGEGDLRESLQQEIDQHGLNIHLKGRLSRVYDALPEYDLYVMPSSYEGFGIAPVEAMAIGLPLLLSDLPVLREVTHNNALFFNPQEPSTFVQLIKEIFEQRYDLKQLSANGIDIAADNYQKKDYLPRLDFIYKQVIEQNQTVKVDGHYRTDSQI